MEDDDEFGDLYTEVLRPLTESSRIQYQETDAPVAFRSSVPSPSHLINLNINRNEDALSEVSDANTVKPNLYPAIKLKFNAPIRQNAAAELVSRPDGRRFDLNLDSNLEVTRIDDLAGNEGGNGVALKTRVLADSAWNLSKNDSGGLNLFQEENDINILLEEGNAKDDDLVEKYINLIDGRSELYSSAARNENEVAMVGEGMDFGQNIPLLSDRLENQGASNFDDEWDSEESEDDLQIVLNDDSHAHIGMERMPGMHDEDDEDGEPLVIVADNGDVGHHLNNPKMMMMEEQDWVGEEALPGIDGEKNELGDTTKTGVVGGTATPATVLPRIGFSNHMYHHSFHSQFKYVRPGAPLLPGATLLTSGGTSGQVCPPATFGPVVERGRGDWRPAGLKGALSMQKWFHPGYGITGWGTNAAGRGYGSGLDFNLPSHKTIFEVDIDSFEDKPWNIPGIETPDFFNFGLNENSWKDYCKHLEQLRLETTMQSKIRVYESGRAEQDYDPDLPPELATAVGIQDIPSEIAIPGNSDADHTEVVRESARERPPLLVGRPIPVETGSGDRLPSTDTRRLRMHNSDAVIEIVCQGSADDDDMMEHQDSDQAAENFRAGEVDGIRLEQVEDINDSFVEYKVQKREQVRKSPSENISGSDRRKEDDLKLKREQVRKSPSENISGSDGRKEDDLKLSAHYDSNRDFVGIHNGRSAEGKVLVGSPKTIASDNEREKETVDYHNEDSFDTGDGWQSPFSSFHGSDEQDTVNRDDMNDNSTMNDESIDVETNQMVVDVTTRMTLEDNCLIQPSARRKKISSLVEQLSEDNDDRKVKKSVRSSDSSKARSASSKDYRKFRDSVEVEVLQEKYPRRAEIIKRLEGDEDNFRRKGNHEKDETGRRHSAMKGRDDSYSRKGTEIELSHHWRVKNGSSDWRKESDIFEGSQYGRDEDLQRGRIHSTKRMHGGDTSSRSIGKARESERIVKDEHQLSRKQLENGGWRGAYHDHEIGSRQRDRDGYLTSRSEKDDYLHTKRRKEDMPISQEHAEKEGLSYNHRESSIRRKRERDDGTDYRKMDDQARIKDADLYHARQKEESLLKDRSGRQKKHNEWHKHKKSHEKKISLRDKETRPALRSRQASEDKTIINHSRGKDEYKCSGRDLEDVGRHTDQPKRNEWIENETFSQQKSQENAYAQGNQFTNDEKRTRSARPGPRDERDVYFSDSSRAHEHYHRDSSRKKKEFESGERNSLIPSEKTQNEHSGQISKTVNIRAKTEEQKDKNESQIIHLSSRKHGEVGSSDEEHPDSWKGRSKFERWTSHQERDVFITSISSSSLNNKDPDAYSSEVLFWRMDFLKNLLES